MSSITDSKTGWATGSIISEDGTQIGYRRIGSGPALLVWNGGMGTTHNVRELAEELAANYTVFVPDRRGRGLSGPFGDSYSLASEVEDVEAMLRESGAERLFGWSTGALAALKAALALPAIKRLVVYEPGLGTAPTEWVKPFDDLMARGKVADALVLSMKATKMGPEFLDKLPNWLVVLMTRALGSMGDPQGVVGYASMNALAPTLHYEAMLLEWGNEPKTLQRLKQLQTRVLLLNGSRSPQFQREAVYQLANTLPNAEHVELVGLDHGGPGNADRGGKPTLVAGELRRFLS